MKYFAVILSVYMVFLMVLPCSDIPDHVSGQADTSVTASSWHTENHTHGADSCSPFCCCACCGSIYTFQPAPQFTIQQAELHREVLPYTKSFHSYELNSIWQPPKIA